MLSKSQIKLITSLAQKKGRTKNGLFFVEGIKGITEILESDFTLHSIYTTSEIFNSEKAKTFVVSEGELKKISKLKTPQTAVALFEIPGEKEIKLEGLVLALDGVRDPGNLGTIIRLCDWFGIEQLLCSKDTVDCYNPKVVQATMGSITRISINYKDLKFLKAMKYPICGAFLEGENVYNSPLPQNTVILLGNEANGISENIEKLVTRKLNIPQFSKSQNTESLNVATATAILLSEFRRRGLLESEV